MFHILKLDENLLLEMFSFEKKTLAESLRCNVNKLGTKFSPTSVLLELVEDSNNV